MDAGGFAYLFGPRGGQGEGGKTRNIRNKIIAQRKMGVKEVCF